MKNLKKCAAFLLAAVVLVSALGSAANASAATLTAKQYLAKMEKAVKKAKSFETTQTTTTAFSIAGQTVESKQTMKQIMFMDPLKLKTVSTTKSAMGNSKTVMYIEESSDGKLYCWTSTDGSAYEKEDLTEFYSSLGGVDSTFNSKLYSDAKIEKKSVKVDKVNTVQISAKIKGSAMAEIMKEIGLDDETLEALNVDFSKAKPLKVTVWVDKKTYCPVKMTMDAKAFYNSLMGSMGAGSEMTYSKAKITSKYKNFNKATKFSLPAACK